MALSGREAIAVERRCRWRRGRRGFLLIWNIPDRPKTGPPRSGQLGLRAALRLWDFYPGWEIPQPFLQALRVTGGRALLGAACLGGLPKAYFVEDVLAEEPSTLGKVRSGVPELVENEP